MTALASHELGQALTATNGRSPADGPMVQLERMTGIEPALSAWEAEVLPLNYIRVPGTATLQGDRNRAILPSLRR